MINLSAIRQASMVEEPYRHVFINDFISKQTANALRAVSPRKGGLFSSRQTGSDKHYQVENNILYDLATKMQVLVSPWNQFVEQLISKSYREAISHILGYSVHEAPMEITFKRYVYGDYISAHTDRDFVYATHLIFLNDYWDPNWGGMLQILDSQQSVVKLVAPLYHESFLFERSDYSWHAVDKNTHPDAVRYCLQVAFWKHTNKVTLPGRKEIANV